jgi:hypothetical protein
MATGNHLGNAMVAAGVGALDGLAASRDVDAGRHWGSPGIGLGGGVVLDWGWATGVESASVVLGTAGVLTGRRWGEPTLVSGVALFSRAAAFHLAQRRRGTAAVPTQGYVARSGSVIQAQVSPILDTRSMGPHVQQPVGVAAFVGEQPVRVAPNVSNPIGTGYQQPTTAVA